MVKIQIDGKIIKSDENISVLEAALRNGIYIPHLCHHPDLPEHESCRLCVVEVEGEDGVVPSCSLMVRDGLNICTKSEQIDKVRNLAMELLLAAHPEDCSTCPKYGRCELQTLIQYMGVSAARMRTRVKGIKSSEQKLFIHDMNRCVLCGRCVRACNDLRGVKVLQYNRKDMETYIGTLQDKVLEDSDCRFCGACAEVCPTGTIRDLLNYTATEKRDVLIPCQKECPVHTDIPRYVRYVRQGKYEEATAVIHEKIPFPESLGRVCAHPCEMKCRRGEINESVSIRNLKRFASEQATEQMWKKNGKQLPETGKKVCVVGAGPAGLTAAYYLAKQGHEVTLKEQFPKFGGQMQYGIPSYRLPREVVDREVSYLSDVGVKLEAGIRVEHPAELLSDYDAVLMAVGTHAGIRLPMEGNNLNGVMVNTEFLHKASEGKTTGVGKKVIVLGGGNVAFDCARTSKRLGAEEIHLACLESREKMLADDEEIEQAVEEGIQIHPAQTFERILGMESVEGVQFMNVKSFSFDENRRAIIEKEEGSEHIIPADTVIFATGQRPDITEDAGLELGRGNSIVVDFGYSLQTSVKGIFACGDVIYGTKTVVQAIASGREAASEIDCYLGGDGDISEELVTPEIPESSIGRIEGFAYLKRKHPEILSAEQRCNNFNSMDHGFCETEACGEAERCLQCDLRFNIHSSRIWSEYSNAEKEEIGL